jgi:endonuclease/exonuclease/phosphatase family metal-dependent hydrolase
VKIKVLHLNIERDKHLDKIRGLIKEQTPDVICFSEAVEADVKNISKEFKYDYKFSHLVKTGRGLQGSAIFSKLPILNSSNLRYDENPVEVVPLVDIEHDSKDGNRAANRFLYHYSLLSIVLENDKGKKITIATTHFPVADHSTPGYEDHTFDESSDIREVNHARKYFDNFLSLVRKMSSPLVFTADLNNPRGEYVYDTLAHELVDLTPKEVKSTLDPVLYRFKKLNLVVDTIMTSPDILTNSVVLIENVSDHKALIAELEV